MRTFKAMEVGFWQSIRSELLEGLSQCTESQRILFCKIHADDYHEGMTVEVVVARMPHDQLRLGMNQVERTLDKCNS